jgi:hypothetical protein
MRCAGWIPSDVPPWPLKRLNDMMIKKKNSPNHWFIVLYFNLEILELANPSEKI